MFFCEYKEEMLPFVYDSNPEDLYAGILGIEAYGNILSENKYLTVSCLILSETAFAKVLFLTFNTLLECTSTQIIKITSFYFYDSIMQ